MGREKGRTKCRREGWEERREGRQPWLKRGGGDGGGGGKKVGGGEGIEGPSTSCSHQGKSRVVGAKGGEGAEGRKGASKGAEGGERVAKTTSA